MRLSMCDDERVKLAQLIGIVDVRKHRSDDIAIGQRPSQAADALRKSPKIGIDHDGGSPEGIEQDRIGGFRSDAIDCQQGFT